MGSTTGSVFRFAAAAVVSLTLAPAAFAASFWVGNGGAPPCTHATLQAAIEAAQSNGVHDFIFLVGAGPFTGPFSIVGADLEIVGGVPSCGSSNSTGYATLRAASGSRPLSILNGGGRISLRRLKITTQLGTVNGDGGGIWFAGSGLASELFLNDSQVFSSGAFNDGGGIFISNGTLILAGNSLVFSNTARNGGGIAAINDARVEVRGSVTANAASFDGGGIYAPDAAVSAFCHAGDICLVANNTAGEDGGGIYFGDGPLGTILSSALDAPVFSILGNQARRGGGLFIDGGFVTLKRAEIDLNTASEQGGGAYVAADGLFTSYSGSTNDGAYPRFTRNQAVQGRSLFVDGADVRLISGTFRGHSAGGGAVAAVSGDARLILESVTLSGNQVPELFLVEEDASLVLAHTSIAGNDVAGGLVRQLGSQSEVEIIASAFSETERFFSASGTAQTPPVVACSVSHFASLLQGMPAGTALSQILVADPRFVNPGSGNLHTFPLSPAVDRCTDTDVDLDSEQNERGFDDPWRPNPAGQTWDAGADESIGVFWDDLEAGNTARWSFTSSGIAGANNVQVTSAARLGPPSSQRGLQVNLVNPSVQAPNATYVLAGPDRGFSNETRLKGSFFIDPQNLTMSSTPGVNSFQMIAFSDGIGAGTRTRLILHLVRGNAAGWFINALHWNDNTGGFQFSGGGFFACADASCGVVANWHQNRIDFEWQRGNPGRLTMWRTRYLNGVPDASGTLQMFSVDLPGMQNAVINDVFAGMFGSQDAGTFGQLFLDEFSFRR